MAGHFNSIDNQSDRSIIGGGGYQVISSGLYSSILAGRRNKICGLGVI